MADAFDLGAYLTRGVERLARDAVRATLRNPRESAFLARFAAVSALAAGRRAKWEREGLHVPPFLMASLTGECGAGRQALSAEDWRRLFRESASLGVSFILLAGGVPLRRMDVLEAAGEFSDVVFPVLADGEALEEAHLQLFDRRRNLVPLLRIGELSEPQGALHADTAARMDALRRRGLLYGAVIPVREAAPEAGTAPEHVKALAEKDCKLAVFMEPVPGAGPGTALTGPARERFCAAFDHLRRTCDGLLCIAFPGDEMEAGECMAAGRSFFHINACGDAEPCLYAGGSDRNAAERSLRDAIGSPYFARLRDSGVMCGGNGTGCLLAERREQAAKLLEAEGSGQIRG